MNFVFQAEDRRIQVAQQAVAYGGFGLDEFFQYFEVKFRARDFLEHPQVMQAVDRHVVSRQNLRAAKKKSLEVNKAPIACFQEIGSFFDFFCQHAVASGIVVGKDHSLLLLGSESHVDLDDVGDLGEGSALLPANKVIESDQISGFLQFMAGGNHLSIRWHAFQDFDDSRRWRQEHDQAIDQRAASAVDKGAPAIAENVKPDQQRAIHRSPGSLVAIATESIFQTLAEQQFIAKDLFFAVHNRLARDIAQRPHVSGWHKGRLQIWSMTHIKFYRRKTRKLLVASGKT